MNKDDIKKGTLVRLKTGAGPVMVVQHVDSEFDIIECVWDEGKGRRLANDSSAALMEAADPATAPSPPTIALPTPVEITNSLKKFMSRHPDERRTAFIMMKYGKTQAHSLIAPTIKTALESHLITGLRVDDGQVHPDLLWNIVTYMHGCGFGVAVFERIENEDYNPTSHSMPVM